MRRLATVVVALALPFAAAGAYVDGRLPCALVPPQPGCQLIVGPGPWQDTLAAVRVVGAPSYPSEGELRLTTILVSDEADLATWWRLRLGPDHVAVPRARFLPEGTDVDAMIDANRAVMERSHRVATVAGLAAAGHPVDDVSDLERLGFDVDVATGDVGGPSAGLMLALAVVDRLTPEDLTGGLIIAGSGSITVDGTVGAVGGIHQKLVGALDPEARRPVTVFLVPRTDLPAARRVAVAREVLLVPVSDLTEALDALATLRDGREPAGSVRLKPA
jgi:Lon-like protease